MNQHEHQHDRSPLARRLRTASMFSLEPASTLHAARLRAHAARAVGALLAVAPQAGIALVVGPSGSGKSTVLRAAARRFTRAGRPVIEVAPPARLLRTRRHVLDLLHADLDDDLRLLSAVGLAEAPLWLRRVRHLSEGQRARLALALACRAGQERVGACLVADEFGALLDVPAATSLCVGLRRALPNGVLLIAATCREDVERPLRPDAVLRLAEGFLYHGRFGVDRPAGEAYA